LIQSLDGAVWSIPPQWTDLTSEDPEVGMGGGQALLRFTDLIELANLVEMFRAKRSCQHKMPRKDKYAAIVKQTTPHGGQNG